MKRLELSFLQNELNRTANWIEFADKKSAFLSAYYSGLFLAVLSYKQHIVSSISSYKGWCLFFYSGLVIIAIALFILGILFLFSSVFPHLKNNLTNKSLFYFGNIAKLKFIDYFKEMEELTEETTKKQISEQIYTNSIIADQKMRNVKNSTKCLFILVILILILSVQFKTV